MNNWLIKCVQPWVTEHAPQPVKFLKIVARSAQEGTIHESSSSCAGDSKTYRWRSSIRCSQPQGLGCRIFLAFIDFTARVLGNTDKCALMVPTPNTQLLAPKPPCGGRASYTYSLVHGTKTEAAKLALLDCMARPASWTYNSGLTKSQMPTYGLFSIGQAIGPARPLQGLLQKH